MSLPGTKVGIGERDGSLCVGVTPGINFGELVVLDTLDVLPPYTLTDIEIDQDRRVTLVTPVGESSLSVVIDTAKILATTLDNIRDGSMSINVAPVTLSDEQPLPFLGQ